MGAAAAVARGRKAAEALMVDECEITYASGGATNVDTGAWEENTETLYAGKCRVQVQDVLTPQTPDYGGGEVTLQRSVVAIPILEHGQPTQARVGAVVRITAVGPDSDPGLVDRRYTVAAVHHKTHATSRRLQCEEVTAGG